MVRPSQLFVSLLLVFTACAVQDDAAPVVVDDAPTTANRPGPPPPGPAGPPPGPGGPGGPAGPVGPNGPPGAGGNPLSFGVVDLTIAAPADPRAAQLEASCAGCDIVLVTICSLRRDHLGAYGAAGNPTPNLDRIAAEGMRFDQAWSASNFTLPSLASILTGRFPSTLGVLAWDRGLGDDVPTLPQVLGYYGYRTGAFTVDAPSGFRPEFGLDRGFQRMVVMPPPAGTPDGRHAAAQGQASDIRPAAPVVEWIAEQPTDQPIFAMFHDRSAHYPFVVAEPESDPTGVRTALWREGMDEGSPGERGSLVIQRDPVAEAVRAAGDAGVAEWKAAYGEAVARMDTDIGELMAALERRGRLDRTILIVVADHGESLDDHGELLHGVAYFDGVVHVPLLIRAPGVQAGARTAALAGHVDLLPTLLTMVGAEQPAGIDGVSLLPVLGGSTDAVRSTTIVEGGVMQDRPESLRGAVVAPPWVLIRQPPSYGAEPPAPDAGIQPGQLEERLYHLFEDPAQEHDLAERHGDVVEELRTRWQGYRAARAGQGVPQKLLHDPAFIKLLQETGYDFKPMKDGGG